MSIISISNLSKTYLVPQKSEGLIASINSIFSRKYKKIMAVKNVSFEINQGELVGFIGPNGAGKTTTLKMLSGLLYPTSGQISVLNNIPSERNYDFLKKISLVMGQKNQLWWDLPAVDSFKLNKEIYEVSDSDYKNTLNELVSILDIEDYLNSPVRKLSLGQRMKCEIVSSLIHRPQVLFLDEPTIGLDVLMQKILRDFFKEYNKKYNATILLTSHYMDDVIELCKRIIVIDKGIVIYDGLLSEIYQKYATHKIVTVIFDTNISLDKLKNFGRIKNFDSSKVVFEIPRNKVSVVTAKILSEFSVIDLNIEEDSIEDVVRMIFSQKS